MDSRITNLFSLFGRNGHVATGNNGAVHAATSDFVTIQDRPYTAAGYLKQTLRKWFAPVTSANTEQDENDRKTLVARSYDAYRNQELARGIVGRLETSVVNVGLKLDPCIDGEYLGLDDDATFELETLAEREFEIWAKSKDVDAARALNFYGIQALALATKLITGDCFINTPMIARPEKIYELSLQLIDPERVCNPNWGIDTPAIRKGIEIDENGAPVAIHVLGAHPADIATSGGKSFTWERRAIFGESGRRRILHLYKVGRAESVRGVGYLVPILEPLKDIKRYSSAEMAATVLNALMTVFIEQDASSTSGMLLTDEDYKKKLAGLSLGEGSVFKLPAGLKANLVAPNRPNQNFESFYLSIVQAISSGLNIPPDEVLLKFDSSYSAARAAMLKAWQYYRVVREEIASFCNDVYQVWFDEAVARGILPVNDYSDPRRRAAYTGAEWIGIGRGSIDEPSEVQAAQGRVNMGCSDLITETAGMTGSRFVDVMRRQRRAIKIAEKYGIVLLQNNQASPSLAQKQQEDEGKKEGLPNV